MICRFDWFWQKRDNSFRSPIHRLQGPGWAFKLISWADRLGPQHHNYLITLVLKHIVVGLILGIMMAGLSGVYVPIALAVDYNKDFLVDADFSGRDLTDASFTKANLRGANLSQANLSGVSFFGANLEAANLENANLTNATLDTARLARANLKNAVLEGAFAFNAKFDGATIDGADFTDVLLRYDVQDQLCAIAQGTNPITKRNTRETLMCE